MECNICKNKIFVDMNARKNVRCEKCGSLERTRLLWMYLKKLDLNKSSKILHLAPEKGLYDALIKIVKEENYVTADFVPELYKFAENCIKIDLCDLDKQPSNQYDLIVHSHVLEHTPCNVAYTLFHLHRMLKKSGNHICVIPIMSGKYDECFQDLTDEERITRFGQDDHVRRFGRDDIFSHLGKIINIPKEFNAEKVFGKEALDLANIPEGQRKGLHAGTILNLKKEDYLL